eukprot:SAG31_NODE_32317_length_357_cov_0.984496_1_plen_40_part_10
MSTAHAARPLTGMYYPNHPLSLLGTGTGALALPKAMFDAG